MAVNSMMTSNTSPDVTGKLAGVYVTSSTYGLPYLGK